MNLVENVKEKKKFKVYVVGQNSFDYVNWWNMDIVSKMEDCDVICLTGGEDVSSVVYGEPQHKTTYNDINRDRFEVKEIEKARKLGKKQIGVCRGCQILGATSGAILVQDQERQPYIHNVKLYNGKAIKATSSHHQAVFVDLLPENKYKLLGWTENLSKYHHGFIKNKECEMAPNKEVEICYFPETNALLFQMHMEWLYGKKEYEQDVAECKIILDNFMNGTI